jgi:hypothetical protein
MPDVRPFEAHKFGDFLAQQFPRSNCSWTHGSRVGVSP